VLEAIFEGRLTSLDGVLSFNEDKKRGKFVTDGKLRDQLCDWGAQASEVSRFDYSSHSHQGIPGATFKDQLMVCYECEAHGHD